MRLRTLKVPEEIDLRLSNRADGLKQSKADLARQYLDEFLGQEVNLTLTEKVDSLVLRTFYLTSEQDTKLDDLVIRAKSQGIVTSKGQLFRAALRAGLGVADGPI